MEHTSVAFVFSLHGFWCLGRGLLLIPKRARPGLSSALEDLADIQETEEARAGFCLMGMLGAWMDRVCYGKPIPTDEVFFVFSALVVCLGFFGQREEGVRFLLLLLLRGRGNNDRRWSDQKRTLIWDWLLLFFFFFFFSCSYLILRRPRGHSLYSFIWEIASGRSQRGRGGFIFCEKLRYLFDCEYQGRSTRKIWECWKVVFCRYQVILSFFAGVFRFAFYSLSPCYVHLYKSKVTVTPHLK